MRCFTEDTLKKFLSVKVRTLKFYIPLRIYLNSYILFNPKTFSIKCPSKVMFFNWLE